MGNSKTSRPQRMDLEEQPTFLLPKRSIDSALISNIDDSVSESVLDPTFETKSRPESSKHLPKEHKDVINTLKPVGIDPKAKRELMKRKDLTERDGESNSEKAQGKIKKPTHTPKPRFIRKVRRKLSFKAPKNSHKSDNDLLHDNGTIVTDPSFHTSSTTDKDPQGKLRTGNHITAEIKIHIWRDKYEGGGRLERLLKMFHRKNTRTLIRSLSRLDSAPSKALRRGRNRSSQSVRG